jgi:type IV fimbrial biogenesis protein FimT
MRTRPGKGGFTLLEAMVTLTVLAIAIGIGLPSFLSTIYRARLEGAARQISAVMQSSRFNAIKHQRRVQVEIATDTGRVFAFVDDNADTARDAEEEAIGQVALPGGLSFKAPGAEPAVDGFATVDNRGFAIFVPDGSVVAQGAFRIGDERSNFLEIRVAPQGTAKVEVRKWDGTDWWARGEGGHPWIWN